MPYQIGSLHVWLSVLIISYQELVLLYIDETVRSGLIVDPLPADLDYCRFQPVLLVDQIKCVSKHHDLSMLCLQLNKYE